MRHFFLAILVALSTTACTDKVAAHEALQAAGFTNIETTGWAGPFSCGQDDFTETGFVATSPRGQRVKGAVCCKSFWFGACTVRF